MWLSTIHKVSSVASKHNLFQKDLCQLFSEAANESGTDGALAGVWAEVSALVDRKVNEDHCDRLGACEFIRLSCHCVSDSWRLWRSNHYQFPNREGLPLPAETVG